MFSDLKKVDIPKNPNVFNCFLVLYPGAFQKLLKKIEMYTTSTCFHSVFIPLKSHLNDNMHEKFKDFYEIEVL